MTEPVLSILADEGRVQPLRSRLSEFNSAIFLPLTRAVLLCWLSPLAFLLVLLCLLVGGLIYAKVSTRAFQAWEQARTSREDFLQLVEHLLHGFKELKMNYGAELDEADLLQLLKVLEIDHKVSFRDGAWTTLDLSQGQRKRLGLLQAVLDPAPILVLDEFAADQDPQFRAKFYREILPMLTRRGKTVVAITHDENYFSQADRIVHMSEGQII